VQDGSGENLTTKYTRCLSNHQLFPLPTFFHIFIVYCAFSRLYKKISCSTETGGFVSRLVDSLRRSFSEKKRGLVARSSILLSLSRVRKRRRVFLLLLLLPPPPPPLLLSFSLSLSSWAAQHEQLLCCFFVYKNRKVREFRARFFVQFFCRQHFLVF
jgi:hypothetical protein